MAVFSGLDLLVDAIDAVGRVPGRRQRLVERLPSGVAAPLTVRHDAAADGLEARESRFRRRLIAAQFQQTLPQFTS